MLVEQQHVPNGELSYAQSRTKFSVFIITDDTVHKRKALA